MRDGRFSSVNHVTDTAHAIDSALEHIRMRAVHAVLYRSGIKENDMKAITLVALTVTSSMSLAMTQLPSPPKAQSTVHFDCGSLTSAQAEKIQNETSSDGLKDLAKTCEEQAEGFQQNAEHASNVEKPALYAKAANAHLFVASFTNSAWMKN